MRRSPFCGEDRFAIARRAHSGLASSLRGRARRSRRLRLHGHSDRCGTDRGNRPGRLGELGDAPKGSLAGRIVLPLFVDAHTHLDKAHIWRRAPNPTGDFAGALKAVAEDRAARWTAGDVARRMEFCLAVGLRARDRGDPDAYRQRRPSNPHQLARRRPKRGSAGAGGSICRPRRCSASTSRLTQPIWPRSRRCSTRTGRACWARSLTWFPA